MDIEVARTFLAVVETGSFFEAARRIHVTQSAVSMRIRTLERQLGCEVFERHHHGVTPTPAGERFQRHAKALVRTWAQAKIDAAGPVESAETLAVGAPPSLWESWLIEVLPELRASLPEAALRAKAAAPAEALRRLDEGSLDLVLLYGSAGGPGLAAVELFEDELVLVESGDGTPGAAPGDVAVDWRAELGSEEPDWPGAGSAALRIAPGVPLLRYLRAVPARAYLPGRLVRPLLAVGELRLVEGAERFGFSVQAVFRSAEREEGPGRAAALLERLAQREG